MPKIIAWFSFGISLEVEDPENISEIASVGRPKLIELITSDSIGENIEDVSIDEYADDYGGNAKKDSSFV